MTAFPSKSTDSIPVYGTHSVDSTNSYPNKTGDARYGIAIYGVAVYGGSNGTLIYPTKSP